MSEDSNVEPPRKERQPFDILRLLGFTGGKKETLSPEGLPYASLNLRMIAASVDQLLVTILLVPLSDVMKKTILPPPGTLNLSEAMRSASPSDYNRAFWDALKASGFIDRWVLDSIVFAFVFGLYSIIGWLYFNGTLGKKLFRLRIIDVSTQQPIRPSQALLRYAGYFLSPVFGIVSIIFLAGIFAQYAPLLASESSMLVLVFLLLFFLLSSAGYFWISFDSRRQAWHDKLAKTAVVVVPRKKRV